MTLVVLLGKVDVLVEIIKPVVSHTHMVFRSVRNPAFDSDMQFGFEEGNLNPATALVGWTILRF